MDFGAAPELKRVKADTMAEPELTYSIWLYLEVLCSCAARCNVLP